MRDREHIHTHAHGYIYSEKLFITPSTPGGPPFDTSENGANFGKDSKYTPQPSFWERLSRTPSRSHVLILYTLTLMRSRAVMLARS